MLTLGICQSSGKIGQGVVEGDEAHGQLRFLGLFLLVLGCQFLGPILIFLLLIHHIDCRHLTHPGLYYGVDKSLATGKVTGDVGDEVQPASLTVHIEHYACGKSADTRTYGCHYRHCQRGAYGFYRLFHALRHLL